MARKRKKPLVRGPKGGKKHTPGRGHDAKSRPAKKRRFAKRAAKDREVLRREAERQWAGRDALPDDVKRLRPDLHPRLPRPADES